MESFTAVSGLAALAHEGRLAIFRLLVEAGPEGKTVGEIASAVEIPAATLSFHLSQLKHASLVRVRRVGRQLIQTADFDQMNELVGYLTENCCGGQSCAPVCKPMTTKSAKLKKRSAA